MHLFYSETGRSILPLMHIARLLPCMFIVSALLCASGFARQDQIKKKQSQLQRLRKEINDYEKKIKEKEKKERATLDLLDSYDRQAVLLRKLIRNLQQEEGGTTIILRYNKASGQELTRCP